MHLDALGWDDGVAEFDRQHALAGRRRCRIFRRASKLLRPALGGSWPRNGDEEMGHKILTLDAGRHAGLDGKPFYYVAVNI